MYAVCAYNLADMDYEWDPIKAASNHKKHGVRFSDATAVFEDEWSLWREDVGGYDEERFVVLGTDFLGRILVVAFTYRDDNIRLVSAREATRQERKSYEQKR